MAINGWLGVPPLYQTPKWQSSSPHSLNVSRLHAPLRERLHGWNKFRQLPGIRINFYQGKQFLGFRWVAMDILHGFLWDIYHGFITWVAIFQIHITNHRYSGEIIIEQVNWGSFITDLWWSMIHQLWMQAPARLSRWAFHMRPGSHSQWPESTEADQNMDEHAMLRNSCLETCELPQKESSIVFD